MSVTDARQPAVAASSRPLRLEIRVFNREAPFA